MNGQFGGGLGTQEEPFLIEDWADFAAMQDYTAYYKMTTDLDANDYNNGVWSTMSIKLKELDADNHMIRNIYFDTSATAITINTSSVPERTVGTVKNLKMENIVCPNGYVFEGWRGSSRNETGVIFKNCTIYAICKYLFYYYKNSSGYSYPYISVQYSNITISGFLFYVASYSDSSSTIENSMVTVYATSVIGSYSGSGTNVFGMKLINSKYVGKFIGGGSGSFSCNCKNSVIDVDLGSPVGFSSFSVNGDTSFPTIFNTDSFSMTLSGSGYIGCTQEQFNDVEWLRDHGFMIAGRG